MSSKAVDKKEYVHTVVSFAQFLVSSTFGLDSVTFLDVSANSYPRRVLVDEA